MVLYTGLKHFGTGSIVEGQKFWAETYGHLTDTDFLALHLTRRQIKIAGIQWAARRDSRLIEPVREQFEPDQIEHDPVLSKFGKFHIAFAHWGCGIQ